MKNKAMVQYLRELKRALRCPYQERRSLLSQVEALLENFGEENPESDLDAFVTAFGPPEMFAEEMLSTLDQEKLAKSRTGQKWLLCSIAALTMTLLITAAFWFTGQAESKPTPDKDEQIPNISVITDDDSENPIVFSFGFSPDESKGHFYWNQHESEDNEP